MILKIEQQIVKEATATITNFIQIKREKTRWIKCQPIRKGKRKLVQYHTTSNFNRSVVFFCLLFIRTILIPPLRSILIQCQHSFIFSLSLDRLSVRWFHLFIHSFVRLLFFLLADCRCCCYFTTLVILARIFLKAKCLFNIHIKFLWYP